MITLNRTPIEFGSYPNGETLIKSVPHAYPKPGANSMTFKYESDQDLIRLMLVRRHLGDVSVYLTIRYMPYSRMDRAEYPSVFTLRYVADFINALDFTAVTVEEPHSDVTCAVLDRSKAVYPTVDLLPDVIKQIGWHMEYDYLFFPDAGAQKRYANVLGYKTAVGFKHRDFATGKLSGEMDAVGFKSQADPTKVLILDDLCSYGGTFIMAAKKLRSLGANEVYLFVTHCENAMFDNLTNKDPTRPQLMSAIDGLYCTDSLISINTRNAHRREVRDKIHVYSEGEWK